MLLAAELDVNNPAHMRAVLRMQANSASEKIRRVDEQTARNDSILLESAEGNSGLEKRIDHLNEKIKALEDDLLYIRSAFVDATEV